MNNKETGKNAKFDFGITSEIGCEEFLKTELAERFQIDAELGENWVTFSETMLKLAEVMYLSQSAKRVVLRIDQGTFDGIENLDEMLKKKMESSQVLELVAGKSTRIVCERTGTHDFNSMDAEQTVMASLKEVFAEKKKEFTVNLNTPDIILFLRIFDDKYIFGIDCAGRELSKRQHLVFNNANSIKGTIGFAALTYAGYTGGDILLDPFSLSGNIVIESALLESGISPNFYSKKFTLLELPEFREIMESAMKKADGKIKTFSGAPDILSSDSMFNNVSAQKKNAKIAGVEKYISFSRTDIYNLDIKTFIDRIDIVCSRPPEPSNHFSESQARNICSTMFKTLKFVLKKDAVLVFVVRNPEILEQEAEKEGYAEEGLKQVWQGQQEFFLVKFIAKEIKENWQERDERQLAEK